MIDSTNILPFHQSAAVDDPPAPPDLDELAQKINVEHSSAQTAMQSALRAGQYLLQAKEQVPRGKWSQWLAAHCPDVSVRTAQYYMRIASECEKHPQRTDTILAGSLREAIAKTAKPKTQRVSRSQETPDPSSGAGKPLDALMDILRDDPLFSGETKAEPAATADGWPTDDETRRKLRALLFDLDSTQKRLRPGLEGVRQLAPLWDFIEQLRRATEPRMH
jgi:hypothetical protein